MDAKGKKRGEKVKWVDDGRVIADMSMNTMPGVFGGRKLRARRDPFGQTRDKPESIALTRKEKWSIIRGVIAAFLLLAVCVGGAFTLFLLFCTKVWFA